MANEDTPPASTDEAGAAPRPEDIEIVIVTMVFDARPDDMAAAERLLGVLSKYVVVSRQEPGCRNIDFCNSVTTPARLVLIEKWESEEAQRAHFDGPLMVEMAQACEGLLARKPEIDLLEGISAHDLV